MCKLEDFRRLIYDFILIYHKKYRCNSVWYVLSPYTFRSLALVSFLLQVNYTVSYHIPAVPTRVGNTSVLPVSVVCDLGVYLHADITMSAHITATVRTCFTALWQIRSVSCSLTQDAVLMLIHALVIKLDFCCSALAGVSGSLMQQLQSVLNAATQSSGDKEIGAHNSLSVNFTGWKFRSEFSIDCVLEHRCLHKTAPPYLAELLHLTTDDNSCRLRLASTSTLVVPSTCTCRSTLGD